MFKLYQVNNKIKSDVRGFWQDNNKKIYIDNIYIKYCHKLSLLYLLIEKSFNEKEKAIFYTVDDKAVILTSNYDFTILKNKKTIIREKLSIKEIKYLLEIYEGFTIFKNTSKNHINYIIEIFY